MVYSSVFPFMNTTLSFYFVRSFVHFFVLLSLLVHQFLFQVFIDPHLSVLVYSLCSLAFFTDSLCLFFYKENQERAWSNLLLLFADALFLSALVAVIGTLGLFFVFVLIFIQIFPLFLFGKLFLSLVFLLFLSALLPIAFLWEGKPSFEIRLSLVVFVNMTLFFIFGFSWLFSLIFKFFEDRKIPTIGTSLGLKPPMYIDMSLNFARKLKPVLNSLVKYFPEDKTNQETNQSVPASLFSQEKGRHHLEQMRKFILDFIEYADPETELTFKDTIDLKEFLTKLLKTLEIHFQKPQNVIQKIEVPSGLKIKGSAPHLKKCFEQILLNSFEALKNQDQPEVKIQGYFEKPWIILKFLDNGHGIEPEDIKKLFDPLFSRRFGLRGLGLPYVQKILKAHKAVLDIASSKKGTKIIIKFPLIYNFYDGSLIKKASKQGREKVA